MMGGRTTGGWAVLYLCVHVCAGAGACVLACVCWPGLACAEFLLPRLVRAMPVCSGAGLWCT